jgi:hypothetical protein
MSDTIENQHQKILSKKNAYSRGRFLTAALIVSILILDQYKFHLSVERSTESKASFISIILFCIALLIHYHSKLKQIEKIEYYSKKIKSLSHEKPPT